MQGSALHSQSQSCHTAVYFKPWATLAEQRKSYPKSSEECPVDKSYGEPLGWGFRGPAPWMATPHTALVPAFPSPLQDHTQHLHGQFLPKKARRLLSAREAGRLPCLSRWVRVSEQLMGQC
jgi:hypothetical protein